LSDAVGRSDPYRRQSALQHVVRGRWTDVGDTMSSDADLAGLLSRRLQRQV
jgi:hypothetical protein